MRLKNLEKKLNFSFKNKKTLAQAFIHRSYLNEVKKKGLISNERLEFLGDAVLAFLTSSFLYQNFPQKKEGELTNLRSAVVCTKTLSKMARKLELGKFLKLSKGEEKEGGRENPSILADTFEAFLGAIYLDQGTQGAQDFLEATLFPYANKIIAKKSLKDPKSLFQEIVQEKIKASPVYKVLKEEGPDHAKLFKVGVFVGQKLYGEGVGKNKQEAEEKAARVAIEKATRSARFFAVAKRGIS